MKFIFIIGTSIFEEKDIKEKDLVSLVFFDNIDLSKEYSRQLIKDRFIINFLPISKCFKKTEELNLNLGPYTVHIKNNKIAILEYLADQQSIFDYFQNNYNYSFLFKSLLNIPIIINRLFFLKNYIFIFCTILIIVAAYDIYLPKVNIQRKLQLLNIDPLQI